MWLWPHSAALTGAGRILPFPRAGRAICSLLRLLIACCTGLLSEALMLLLFFVFVFVQKVYIYVQKAYMYVQKVYIYSALFSALWCQSCFPIGAVFIDVHCKLPCFAVWSASAAIMLIIEILMISFKCCWAIVEVMLKLCWNFDDIIEVLLN